MTPLESAANDGWYVVNCLREERDNAETLMDWPDYSKLPTENAIYYWDTAEFRRWCDMQEALGRAITGAKALQKLADDHAGVYNAFDEVA